MSIQIYPPLISVILTTHQRADLLPRAIESILAQTLESFELIVVDDGSTDETAKVVETFMQCDKRVVYLYQANQGLAAARNRGVHCARGKYIAFMDDDDASAPNRLQIQVNFLETHIEYAACACQLRPIKAYIPQKLTPHSGGEIQFDEIISHFIAGQPPAVLDAGICILRQSFLDCRGYRTFETIVEDLDFTLRFLEIHRAASLYIGLYYYAYPQANLRRNKQSLVNNKPDLFIRRHVASYISAWCRHYKLPDPIEEGKPLDEILAILRRMSANERTIVYKSYEHFVGFLTAVNNMSKWQARRHIAEILLLGKTTSFLIATKAYIESVLYKFSPQMGMITKVRKYLGR